MGNHPHHTLSTPRHTLPHPPGESRKPSPDLPPSHGEPLPTPSTPPPHHPTLPVSPVIPRHDLPARYGGAMIPRNPRGGRPDPFLPGGWTAYEEVGRVGKGWEGRGEGRKFFFDFSEGVGRVKFLNFWEQVPGRASVQRGRGAHIDTRTFNPGGNFPSESPLFTCSFTAPGSAECPKTVKNGKYS